ncbi:hypothetical protein BDZ89DRAFT_995436 [Hymenopellis radicata]|nr:hypothetical protein BDZ89DRAFT_995436 [Hymenopellis radicata]
MNMAYPHHSHNSIAGPSRSHASLDDIKRDKKRKDISGKVGREIHDRRDDGRHYSESISALTANASTLATRPEASQLYKLKLFPLSLERSAQLASLEFEEKYALECAQTAYEEEREKVEAEWKKGHDRVRERLMESIEERRRRARDDKEGEGTVADGTLDSQSRGHITRKLRNKMGTSPPGTPLGALTATVASAISGIPITAGPFLNPHSLAVDELPSPFPLPLTSTSIPTGANGTNGGPGTTGPGGGRRRPKGSGTNQSQAIGGLGKSLHGLTACKEQEIEFDLGEIRRGNKRRRLAATGVPKSVS